MDIVTYLTFDGQCEAAFAHYERVFAGKILMTMRYGEAPGNTAPPDVAARIMHTRLAIGDRLLMGSDAPVGRFSKPQGFAVSVQLDNVADAERIFAALAEGGTVQMPIAETFWAARFGMLEDKFGVPWMVNCERAG